jgi:hypothetical protein
VYSTLGTIVNIEVNGCAFSHTTPHPHPLLKIANDYFMYVCWGGGGFLYPSLFQRVQGSAFIYVFAFHSDSFFNAFADAQKNFAVVFGRMADRQAGNIRFFPTDSCLHRRFAWLLRTQLPYGWLNPIHWSPLGI